MQHHGLMILILDFQGQISKKPDLRNRRADWHRKKGMWSCESIGSGTHYLALNFYLSHDLILNFQGEILKKLYITKGILVDRMLNRLCDLELWPWPWIFKVKFWKSRNPGIGGPIDMEQNGVDMKADLLCDFEFCPLPWPWPWISKNQFWKSYISTMGGSVNMERMGCGSIGCWIHYVTLSCDLARGF